MRTRSRRGTGWAFLVALPVLTACNSAPGSSPPTSRPAAVGGARSLSDHAPITPGYFSGNEKFCALSPLSGSIGYSVSTGTATLKVQLGGLPPTTPVVINWANGTGRAYVVASVRTDAAGSAVPSSVILYRPGEVRGTRIILTSADPGASVEGSLTPCP